MKNVMRAHAVVALMCFASLAGAQAEPETSVETSARSALGITVYSDGVALVRDTRKLDLERGQHRLAFREVAATIRPETASLKSLSGAGIDLIEQNFDFDLLTPEALLAKYVGRDVSVIRTNPATGAESSEKARVLATSKGVVLRYSDRIESGVAGRISFPDVPATLRDRPTLSMLVDTPRGGEQVLELSYLAQQIGWKADYVANLDPSGRRMSLAGWVTLTNQSGAAYSNAHLQLVAGKLNRVAAPVRMMARGAVGAAHAPAAPEVAEERLSDYHLYTLGRATTIAENQTKQVALLATADVPVEREYVLSSGAYESWYSNPLQDMKKGLKPSVFLQFENKGANLGIALPAGVVRVYAPDTKGTAQFIGEDSIAHTPKGEKLSLRLGEAFDLTADRTQTDYRVLGDQARQSSYRIDIRNADSRPATVVVRESLHGDWRIVKETQDHVKEGAATAAWRVEVPPEGHSVLEFTAVVTW